MVEDRGRRSFDVWLEKRGESFFLSGEKKGKTGRVEKFWLVA